MAKKTKLKKCGVEFNQEKHEYWLNGKQLQGITGVLERRLFPDKYKFVSKELMERAAERGTFIHEQIELADSLGVKPDVTEVQNYLKLKEEYGLKILENEYTVSDLENYATNIDGVYDVEENVVDIADYKTTSKFDKESVSWQLSICAYFLEKDNPKVKVRKLFGIWLRGEIARLIEVERKPVELVKALLLADKNDMPLKSPTIFLSRRSRLSPCHSARPKSKRNWKLSRRRLWSAWPLTARSLSTLARC